MNERPCIRCQHPVLLEDGHLVYCSSCGGPQIFLSEELQAELAESTRVYREGSNPEGEADRSPEGTPSESAGWNPLARLRGVEGGSVWTLGVPCALLSAGVALGLGLLSLMLPQVSILMLFWVISAPVLTVAFFTSRATLSPEMRHEADSGFAARLGLLTGLLVLFCCAVIFTLSLLLTRFAFHDAALLDGQLQASFAQQRSLVLARLGPSASPTMDLFTVPEYRVGLLLTVVATTAGFYLVLSTLAGGVAGLVLRRRQP